MTRISIPRRYDALNAIWLKQESLLLQPNFTSDEIQFTSDWLPHSLLYEQDFNYESVVGAAASTTVDGTTVPAGQFWFVPTAQIFHTDGTARRLSVLLRHATTGNSSAIISSDWAVPNTWQWQTQRPFIVPAGHRIRGFAEAIAAGQTVTLQYFFIRGRWGEPIPRW